MAQIVLLTPNEVAELAKAPKTVVEKALEQKVMKAVAGAKRSGRANSRLLPIQAVALAATVHSLGRRLTVDDKRLVARRLAGMPPAALKTATVEVAPAVVIHVGVLARDAVDRAERYSSARDAYIEAIEGVQGGRPVIKGTRITVSSVLGRLTSGDTVEDLLEDYRDIPREAFEAAYLFGKTHPLVGRPARKPARAT